MILYFNISSLLTLKGAAQKKGRAPSIGDLSEIKKAALLVDKGLIVAIDIEKKIFAKIKKEKIKIKSKTDLEGATVIPGLVDCHTHLAFGGNRIAEFEMRNQGASYQEIAARGGGILSTMKATRKLSIQQLQKESQEKVNAALKFGVTTLEIKSGYALNLKDEIKQLKVARGLHGPRVVTTFLGAHAKPPEFSSYEEYLNFLAEKVLPQIKKEKLSNRCDIFIEKGFFENPTAQSYLQTAKSMGFEITIHADQLSLSGGTETAIELGALSADHVIQITDKQISKLAKSETTAVCLPAADLYMKCAYPPARAMIDLGCRVAIASDFNPGSCPTQDLNLVGVLSRLYLNMTLPEVIVGLTLNAAYALKLQDQIGSLEVGKSADFVVSSIPWSEMFYQIGQQWVQRSYVRGKRLY